MKSVSKENYLRAIYKQQSTETEVKANILAESLAVSNAAVTDMLKKLQLKKLVNYVPYKSITLTSEGEMLAKNLLRRHRLWELFLHKIVGWSWDKVHSEAERLEHYSSEELINRIEEMLDFPQFDPHGDPIPQKDGVLPVQENLQILSSCVAGQTVSVTRVLNGDSEFLTYLTGLGLHLHKVIEVLNRYEFDGSLRIGIDGNEQVISNYVAGNILITKVEKIR